MPPKFCPGAANFTGTPSLNVKTCPRCDTEIELFSIDVTRTCSGCGFEAYNDIVTCVQWCAFAKECVGEDMYNKLMARDKENNGQSKEPHR